MYVAEANKIYYCNPNETGSKELFITISETRDCTKTPEQQAQVIAKMLNGE